jgi:hypothetical protein
MANLTWRIAMHEHANYSPSIDAGDQSVGRAGT